MRKANWVALLVVLILVPASPAQRPARTERQIARLMDRLRDEMWAYRQELDFFRRAPEYRQLVELRYRIRGLAIQVAELETRGPGARRTQRELSRQMEQNARELKRLTGRLEERTDVGAPREVRRRADRLKEHADEIRKLIGRLDDMVR
jgi:hypothetical protein